MANNNNTTDTTSESPSAEDIQKTIDQIRSEASSIAQRLEERAKEQGQEDIAKNISDIRGRIDAGDLGDSGDTSPPPMDDVKRRKEGAEEQLSGSIAEIV